MKAGTAVHARGGDRREYRPVESRLIRGSDPVALAAAYRDELGLTDVYIADLDSIEKTGENVALVERVSRLGLKVWLDAGLRDGGATRLLRAGATFLIAATETLSGPEGLASLVSSAGAGSVVLSLDVRRGRTLRPADSTWPSDILRVAAEMGVTRAIRLDLGRVGLGGGTATHLAFLRSPDRPAGTAVFPGGGIGSELQVDDLRAAGAAGVLLGSALHDGRVTRADIGRWASG